MLCSALQCLYLFIFKAIALLSVLLLWLLPQNSSPGKIVTLLLTTCFNLHITRHHPSHVRHYVFCKQFARHTLFLSL